MFTAVVFVYKLIQFIIGKSALYNTFIQQSLTY